MNCIQIFPIHIHIEAFCVFVFQRAYLEIVYTLYIYLAMITFLHLLFNGDIFYWQKRGAESVIWKVDDKPCSVFRREES